ncbi:hypothetical protein [Pseudobutyrivibrio sp.]|uniref:hypothetical protein n=1 Tax=Pseudobutyrivibrio sp. TaxID=2014367 RepID=UPI0025CFCD6B|nr:hypothetical protein [Pseudobutyrivibrio sp.]MBR5648332.1 hypothetical protein [Pseudobutyrivibrio sp.]
MTKQLKNIFFSIIAVAILVAGLWEICPIIFQNNDDKFLLYLTAGYTTGANELSSIFGGFIWSGIIGLFYKISANIAWYTVISLAMIILSLISICYCFISSRKVNWLIIGLIGFVLIFGFSFLYFTAAIQYTVTAAIIGSASVCLLAASSRVDSIKEQKVLLVLSCVMLVLSYSVRKQMGLVAFSGILVLLFFDFFSENKKSVIKTSIILVIVFVVTCGTNMIHEKVTGVSEFNEYYADMQKWIDYPHLTIDEDSDGVYASVGWDQDLYDVANKWFFMDERVNHENIKVINGAYTQQQYTLAERLDRAKGALMTSPYVGFQFLLMFVILLLTDVYAIIRKKFNVTLLSANALIGVCLVASAYFCVYKLRFPLRVYQSLVLVYCIPAILLLKNKIEEDGSRILGISALLIGFVAFIVTYSSYPQYNTLQQAKAATHDTDRNIEISKINAVESYAIEHRDNIYIYDYELSLPASPFINYKGNGPVNVLFWGGWTYGSPMYKKQLEANGRNSIYSKDFIDSNIYIAGKYVDEDIYRYMTDLYDNVDVEIVDAIDDGNVIIYRYVSK